MTEDKGDDAVDVKSRLEQAEAALAAQNELLSAIGHELRSPLTSILGWCHLLRLGHLDEEGAVRAIEIVERNAKLQCQLVEEVVELSRLATGRFHLVPDTVDIAGLVAAAVGEFSGATSAKGQRLEVALEDSLPRLSADPARLAHVLRALVRHAVSLSPKDSRILLRGRREGSSVVLEVEDQGPLPPEVLPYVLDGPGGTGLGPARASMALGLALVRPIVERHGGTAEAVPGSGGGTVLRIALPALEGEGREGAESASLLGVERRTSRGRPEKKKMR